MPETTDPATLKFVLEKLMTMSGAGASLMAELDPDALPVELTEAINGVATRTIDLCVECIRQADALGLPLPDEAREFVRNWEDDDHE